MILVLSVTLWPSLIFAPDLKADWRAAALFLDRIDPARDTAVYVAATGGGPNVEIETARYYLGEKRPIDAFEGASTTFAKPVWVAVGLRDGRETAEVPEVIRSSNIFADFDGLRLYRTRPSEKP